MEQAAQSYSSLVYLTQWLYLTASCSEVPMAGRQESTVKSTWHTSASLRLMFQIINFKSQLMYLRDRYYIFFSQHYMSSK